MTARCGRWRSGLMGRVLGAEGGDVVLATFERGQPEVAACLASDPVSEIGERLCEIVTGDVPRKPQALMTSSRTKWRRMILGTLSAALWDAAPRRGHHRRSGRGAPDLTSVGLPRPAETVGPGPPAAVPAWLL